jgi:hypothetical protein
VDRVIGDVIAVLIAVGLVALYAIPAHRLVARLGYPDSVRPLMVIGWLLVPVVMMWLVAFGDWPAMKRDVT